MEIAARFHSFDDDDGRASVCWCLVCVLEKLGVCLKLCCAILGVQRVCLPKGQLGSTGFEVEVWWEAGVWKRERELLPLWATLWTHKQRPLLKHQVLLFLHEFNSHFLLLHRLQLHLKGCPHMTWKTYCHHTPTHTHQSKSSAPTSHTPPLSGSAWERWWAARKLSALWDWTTRWWVCICVLSPRCVCAHVLWGHVEAAGWSPQSQKKSEWES